MQKSHRKTRARRQAPELLRAITELAPDFVTLFDRNLTIEYVSPAVQSVTGRVPEELIGKHASQFVHPDDVATLSGAHESVLQSHDVVTVMVRFRRKEGSWITLENRARNFLDAPDIGALLVSSRDVTRSVELAETLRRTAAEVEDLFQNAPCGYHSVDARGTFTRVNNTELSWLQYTRAELVGQKNFADLLSPASRLIYEDHAARLGKRAAIRNVEAEVVRKDASSFPALLRSVAACDDTGSLREIRTATFDITERKRSERALAKVARALGVLSVVRREIIRAQSEVGLLDAVCRTLVEAGGYRMACVHYAQQDAESTMKIVAKAGFADREYENAQITWAADTEYGRGLIGTAVRSAKPQISQNLLHDPAVAPWRQLLERSGYQSAVTVPLRDHAGVFATLMVCAGEAAAFEREETNLLRELADDLSFGIGSLLAKKFAEEHAALRGIDRDSTEDPLAKLSRREREVLQLVVEGYSSKEIASRLDVSPASVDTYRSRLMFKLGIGDVASLVRLAIREGLIQA